MPVLIFTAAAQTINPIKMASPFFSWAVAVGAKGGLMVQGAVWAVIDAVCAVTVSVWDVAAFMWAATSSMSGVTAFMYDVQVI